MQKQEWWQIEEKGERPKRKGFMDVAKDDPVTVFLGFVTGVLLLAWVTITFGE